MSDQSRATRLTRNGCAKTGSTYESFSILWREAHLVAGLGLVEEVSPPLQEAHDCVEQAVNAVACLLRDHHKHFIESRLELRVGVSCHLGFVNLIIILTDSN